MYVCVHVYVCTLKGYSNNQSHIISSGRQIGLARKEFSQAYVFVQLPVTVNSYHACMHELVE